MNKLQQAIATLHEIDHEAETHSAGSRIHPAARLTVTALFLVLTMSFSKYDLTGLAGMLLYLLVTSIWEEISLWKGLKRFRYIFLLLFFVGIANPFFDRQVLLRIGDWQITGGMLSMVTLFLKGLLAVCASYFLIVAIGMNGICQALSWYHVPKGAITVLMLIYRYLIVFLQEVQRMSQAYHLRAPRQRGIHIRAWGSFVGLLLLRSIDRAQEVYNSMLLRGFHGTYQTSWKSSRTSVQVSIWYVTVWMLVLIALRWIPVFSLVGTLLVR